MYSWIPWELVADLLRSAEHTLGTTGLWGPPWLFVGFWGIFTPEIKRPGCKANHLPPSGAEVKDEKNYIPHLQSLLGVYTATLPFNVFY
jgi:hypothetical protein